MHDIIPTPGLLTDQTHPQNGEGTAGADLAGLRDAGFDWISYQLVNGGAVTGVDIAPYGLASGFKSCGGWGVVYDRADFLAFGKRFGAELLRQGAQHAIVDAEDCAKGTRDGQGCKPIIDGLRAAGWTGPVHLAPLGAPSNGLPHGPNDFAVDVKSFLATGGGILPQAYFNAYDVYRPDLCVDYWRACGVPSDRLNVIVEFTVEGAKMQRIGGAEWSNLLKAAGANRNFSAYMVQHLLKSDVDGLKPSLTAFTPAPAPTPTPEPTVTNDAPERNAKISLLADEWLKEFGPAPRSRLANILTIAETTDEEWNAVRQDVVDALSGKAAADRARLIAQNADLQRRIANAKTALG